jgi:hypothetical protein
MMHHDGMTMASHAACMQATVEDCHHSGAHPGSGSDKHSCSGASACCVGAAVPPGFAPFKCPPDHAEVHIASVITPVAGHIPDGLERPPRLSAI